MLGRFSVFRDEKHRRKNKRTLHRIREVDERTNSSKDGSQNFHEQLQPLCPPQLGAILSPTDQLPSPRSEKSAREYPGEPVGPCTPSLPERGILKNGPPIHSFSDAEDASPFAARRRLFDSPATPSDRHHDSDPEGHPNISARIFEESMQRIDECGLGSARGCGSQSARGAASPYRPPDYVRFTPRQRSGDAPSLSAFSRPPPPPSAYQLDSFQTSPPRDVEFRRLPSSEKLSVAVSPFLTRGISEPYPSSTSGTPPSYRNNPSVSVAPMIRLPQGYFESSTAPQSSYRLGAESDSEMFMERPARLSLNTADDRTSPPAHGHLSGQSRDHGNMTTSTSHSRPLSPRSYQHPEPLRLRNIDYLMKQLEHNASISLSPSSSQEFSGPEAERAEAGSNTESHLDHVDDHHAPPQPPPKPNMSALQRSFMDTTEDEQMHSFNLSAGETLVSGRSPLE